MIKIKNYINGELVLPKDNQHLDVFNPSNGQIHAKCPNSSIHDLDLAIKSSKSSFQEWSSINQSERSDFLFLIADLIEKNISDFANAESIDNGKPFTLSKSLDIPRSIKNLRFFASLSNSIEPLSYRKENVTTGFFYVQFCR